MRAISFPLIDDLLEEKSGTVCALNDPPGRLRDGMAVVALTQFCAARNVRLRIQQVPASHRRYVDARILLSRRSSEQQRQIDAMLKSDRTLNEKVAELFRTAEGSRMTAEHSDEVIALEPRGPVIVIGRPQLYPKYFQHAIEAELPEGAGIVGRFEMSEPDVEGTKFWEVHDHYFNLAIPQRRGAQDFAVIRKIHGRYSRRTFLLVYGTSSLGTMAAAQLLIDQDLNEDLSRANVAAALQKYGSAELLVHVNLEALFRRGIPAEGSHQAKLWTPELEPHQIQVLAEPAPPVSAEVMNWIRAFEGDTNSGDLQSVYERISADADDLVQYRVTGIHPQAMLAPKNPYRDRDTFQGGSRTSIRMTIVLLGESHVGEGQHGHGGAFAVLGVRATTSCKPFANNLLVSLTATFADPFSEIAVASTNGDNGLTTRLVKPILGKPIEGARAGRRRHGNAPFDPESGNYRIFGRKQAAPPTIDG